MGTDALKPPKIEFFARKMYMYNLAGYFILFLSGTREIVDILNQLDSNTTHDNSTTPTSIAITKFKIDTVMLSLSLMGTICMAFIL